MKYFLKILKLELYWIKKNNIPNIKKRIDIIFKDSKSSSLILIFISDLLNQEQKKQSLLLAQVPPDLQQLNN